MWVEVSLVRKTKIVCTIGPVTSSSSMIERLIKAGMNVARLNFSHGSLEDHLKVIKAIRRASAKLGKPVAILQDLSGPKLRIGRIANQPAKLVAGQEFRFTTEDIKGDSTEASLPFPEIVSRIKKGQLIYLDDAKIELKVLSATDTEVIARVNVGGEIYSAKGFAVPGLPLTMAGVTEKDLTNLRFGLENGVDWIASSFVRSADDVEPLRQVMDEVGRKAPVIAKIERPEAVKNLAKIIEAYDGVMVARGDLGIEVPIEQVPEIQKRIICQANRAGKPVIIATQMLDSMIWNSRPTRAEVTDIANAILDGADATMLSGETAMGQYPIQSVRMMHRVAVGAEKMLDHDALFARCAEVPGPGVTEAIGEAATTLANDLKVRAIITCTYGGTTARLVSKFRPRAEIIAAASNESTSRALGLSWGVTPIQVDIAENTDDLIDKAIKAARERKLVKPGETVVMIAGVPVGVPGSTSLIRVLEA
jgi:pyruvate kinase